MIRTLRQLFATALLLALVGTAAARTDRTVSYGFDDVWPAVLRFLRIDEGCRILEKDAEAGYVLFELKDDGKLFRGALEIVRTRDSQGRTAVRLLLRLEDRPSYMEAGILDRLVGKLRADLGEPAPAPEPTPAPAPDAPAQPSPTAPGEPPPRASS